MSVNRYEFEDYGTNEPDGRYVTYEDYSELEQKLAESQREFRAADATIENLQMKLEKLAAENAGLNAFVDALLSIAWQGGSADGAEIQELALKHGLLRQEVYSADEHETLVDDPGNFENGDPVYFRVETPATDAFLAELRASAIDSLVDVKTKQLADMHPDTHAFGATAMSIRSQINELQVFAAQLRKGVQS